jgi:hypothetical protein
MGYFDNLDDSTSNKFKKNFENRKKFINVF